MMETYRGYLISFEPKPIPNRAYDWDYMHEDYDGAPDAEDGRCGNGGTLQSCKDQIDEEVMVCSTTAQTR